MKFVDSFVLNTSSKLIFCSKISQKGKTFLEVAYKNLKTLLQKPNVAEHNRDRPRMLLTEGEYLQHGYVRVIKWYTREIRE